MLVGALFAILVFLPVVRARFVSDTFVFLESAHNSSFSSLLSHYMPSATSWYRPTNEIVFWLEYRIFGLNPLGYHVVSAFCHFVSTLLLYLIGLRIIASKGGAMLAAIVFLFTIHAHEVVWDIGDLHNALGGVTLLGSLLTYISGARIIALLLVALTMTIDETGALALPLIALYEAVFTVRQLRRRDLGVALLRLVPFITLTLVYFASRLVIFSTGIFTETASCHSAKCVVNGTTEYINRLFVRPEQLLAVIWNHRPLCAVATLIVLAGVSLLLRPRRWHNWRPVIFAAGWVAGSVLYFILALWPYVADRFLYIPDMGLALLIGSAGVQAVAEWTKSSQRARAGVGLAGAILTLWLAAGLYMLWQRGNLWVKAGMQAQSVVDGTYALVPHPPANATFFFDNVPDSYVPSIPPGNTGPYLFRNGLPEALRLRYNRSDIMAASGSPPGTVSDPTTIYLRMTDGRVTLIKSKSPRPQSKPPHHRRQRRPRHPRRRPHRTPYSRPAARR